MPAPSTPFQPYADRHKTLSGPGDSRPTAIEVVKDAGLVGKLQDRVILITGCSAGLGVETARALYLTGAKLFLTVRSREKGEAAIEKTLKDAPEGQQIELVLMDLADLESVRAAADDVLKRTNKLHILINNAGVMAAPQGVTKDGFETHMGSNHYGHFLLFQLLKPLLLASSSPTHPSRTINLSSSGHRLGGIRFADPNFSKTAYDPWQAYGQSKTANIYMANHIDRHYGPRNLRAVSVHPGVILSTELCRHVPPQGLEHIADAEFFGRIEKSAEQGAATTVWAAVAPCFDRRGGVYLADVGEASAAEEGELVGGPGYGAHAYDEEAEEALWRISCEAVGVVE